MALIKPQQLLFSVYIFSPVCLKLKCFIVALCIWLCSCSVTAHLLSTQGVLCMLGGNPNEYKRYGFGKAALLGPLGLADVLASVPNTVNSLGDNSTMWFIHSYEHNLQFQQHIAAVLSDGLIWFCFHSLNHKPYCMLKLDNTSVH